MSALNPGTTVRVTVDRAGHHYTWTGQVAAILDNGTYSVRCLSPGIATLAAGELVEVRRRQLRHVHCYTVGAFAWLDLLGSPLIPCQVTAVHPGPNGGVRVDAKVTATRPGYQRGTLVTDLRPEDSVPRPSLRIRHGHYRILNNYAWLPADIMP